MWFRQLIWKQRKHGLLAARKFLRSVDLWFPLCSVWVFVPLAGLRHYDKLEINLSWGQLTFICMEVLNGKAVCSGIKQRFECSILGNCKQIFRKKIDSTFHRLEEKNAGIYCFRSALWLVSSRTVNTYNWSRRWKVAFMYLSARDFVSFSVTTKKHKKGELPTTIVWDTLTLWLTTFLLSTSQRRTQYCQMTFILLSWSRLCARVLVFIKEWNISP